MISSHLRSNAIGYVALFFALTAGAYAAGLPKDSVKSKQIKNGQVKNADLAEGSVDGSKVANGSLSEADFGSLPQGSPDTGADILAKLDPVAGSGSGLDADYVDGLSSQVFVKASDDPGGDLDGTYANPEIAGDAVTSAEIQGGSVAQSDLAPTEDVTAPTLNECTTGTPWSTPAAFALPVGYWKDRSGVVHLQGSISCTGNATEGQTIFTLPDGYTPSGPGGGVVRFPALSGGVTIAQIAVLNNGPVVYDGPDNATADDYISLDGITFRAVD